MKSTEKTNYMRHWTREEDDILRCLYPDTSMSKMQAELNRGRHAIRSRAEKLGIPKSKAYQEKMRRRRHLFTEGGTPWNKRQEKIGIILKPRSNDESLPVSDPVDNRPHSWNMRPEHKEIFEMKMTACSAIEQALNEMRNSHVHIS